MTNESIPGEKCRALSNQRYYWLVIVPTTVALAGIGNGILFFEDVADYPLGFVGSIFHYAAIGCMALLLLSIGYFAWSSFRRCSSKLRGFVWSIISVTTQLIIALFITLLSFGAAMTIAFSEPKFIGETDTEVHNLELGVLKSKYGIPASELGAVMHYSEWYIGEEMGRDFILSPSTKEQVQVVEAIPFENVGVELPSDLSTSNLQFLCDVSNKNTLVNDKAARQLLCGHLKSPIKANWNLIQVRHDWTVLLAYFPNSKLVWISEVEW